MNRLQARALQRTKQAGFSMIEVLVTLMIITLGLFGVVGLQAFSLRANQAGKYRGQAVFLADDLGQRMEINFPNANGYDVALSSTAPALNKDCTTSTCSGADLMTYDLAVWQAAVAAALPQSSWSVTTAQLAATPNLTSATFTLTWQERMGSIANNTSTATVTATYVTTRLIKTSP